MDRVAAEVHGRATGQAQLPADVSGGQQRRAHPRLDVADRAQLATSQQRDHADRHRVVAVVERLHHDEACSSRDGRHLFCFSGVGRERLLAQHVFAGLECSDGPSTVEAVRQRVVDRIDARVVEQRRIAAVDFRDVMLRRERPRSIRIPRRDRHDLGVVDCRVLAERSPAARSSPAPSTPIRSGVTATSAAHRSLRTPR